MAPVDKWLFSSESGATVIGRRAVVTRSAQAAAATTAILLTPASAPAQAAKPEAPPPKDAADRLLSGQAWEDFCDELRLAGRYIDRFGSLPTDLDRAEWYRFVSRLARNGLERFVENCEANRPRLREPSWRTSINVTSPDQDHLLLEFDEAADYRVTGNRGTIPYFVAVAWTGAIPKDFGAQNWAPRGAEGLKEFDPAVLHTTAMLQSDAIKFEPNGDFEIIASQNKHDGNWLPLQTDSVGIFIRIIYHDRAKDHPPAFRVERLDKAKPIPITPADVSRGLAKAGQDVFGNVEITRAWWQDNLGERLNRIRFSRSTYLNFGGVGDRQFGFGAWKKPADAALVLEFTPPECDFWIFQLCNLWQENLDDYEEGQGYVTKFNARYEPDGSIRVIVAEASPGIGGNWVNSYGHTQGVMGLRLIKTTGVPSVTSYLMPLQTLRQGGWESLKRQTPMVSGEVTK
jgi:hypothetical protein